MVPQIAQIWFISVLLISYVCKTIQIFNNVFVIILQEELIRADVLPDDYDFKAHKELVAMLAGDVPVTYANTDALLREYDFKPRTSLRTGRRNFAEWYGGRLLATVH